MTSDLTHLLRRVSFGPFPGQIDALEGRSYDDVLAVLLSAGSLPIDAPLGEAGAALVYEIPEEIHDDEENLIRWWIERMQSPGAALHEKMVWYWHGHFTSSLGKADSLHLALQQETFRRLALGNFRDLAKAIVVDGAMLLYLDGAGSVGEAPNENLARELMELFTIGRGNYTQADVRAAAKALSGYWVDWETGEVNFERDSSYLGVIEFMGLQGRLGPEDIVDALCDHPACARFIANDLHHYFVGTWPSEERLDEIAAVFRDADLEIAPLLAELLTHPSFLESKLTRPRYAIEWFAAATAALGFPEYDYWQLEGLGQMPLFPPNVGGWPATERWISPSLTLTKGNLLLDLIGEDATFPFDEADPIPDLLRHVGISDPSPETMAAFEAAYWGPFDAADTNQLLVLLALNAPEFSLA